MDITDLNVSIEAINRRLEMIQDGQRLALEKLNRLRLSLITIKREQRRLSGLLAGSWTS